MLNESKVSVVIPTYNGASFLKETLLSVYNQTYANWEAFVVIDGSTDDSLGVLANPPFSTDPRFHIVQTPNLGVSSARSLGLSMSNSPFVALLDHDDIWHPEKLRLQIEVLVKHPDLPGVLTWYLISRKQYAGFDHSRLVAYKSTREMIRGWLSLRGNGPLMTSTLLFRKSMIMHLFDTNYNAIGDLDFVLRIPQLDALSVVPLPLVVYLQHNNQMHNRAVSMLETKKFLSEAEPKIFNSYSLRQSSVINSAKAFAYLLHIFEIHKTSTMRALQFIRDHQFLSIHNYEIMLFVILKRISGVWNLLRYRSLVRRYWP